MGWKDIFLFIRKHLNSNFCAFPQFLLAQYIDFNVLMQISKITVIIKQKYLKTPYVFLRKYLTSTCCQYSNPGISITSSRTRVAKDSASENSGVKPTKIPNIK